MTDILGADLEMDLGNAALINPDHAVQYVPQTLTDAQKSQARQNVDAYAKPSGGIPETDLAPDVQTILDEVGTTVRFSTQTLTNEQKAQARANIDALTDSDLPYVTPEMFGAKGDGVTDDTAAVQAAFNSGKNIRCNGIYRITSAVRFGTGYAPQLGYGKKRVVEGKGQTLSSYSATLNPADATFIFDGGYFDISYVASTMFRDVTFMGATSHSKTDKCFYRNANSSVSHLLVYNCCFVNFDKSILFEDSDVWSGENEFRFNFWANCNYAFYGNYLVDSYVCGNIFHSTCLYSFWYIGGGTFFSENHDYSQKGCAASDGIFKGNYFDGLNKFLIHGETGSVSHMVIDGNLFLYNPGVTDSVQSAIVVDFGLSESVICNNQISGTDGRSIVPSLLLLTNPNGYLNENYINNNSFDKSGCTVIATVPLNVGSLYYANQCDAPLSVSLTALYPNGTTHIIQDIGNETRIVFRYVGNAGGENLVAVDFGAGNRNQFQKSADFTIYNATTHALVKRKVNLTDCVVNIWAEDLTGVDYATDGIEVIGTISILKGNARSSAQRQYYARQVTLE